MSIKVNELDEASHVNLKGNCFRLTGNRSCTVIYFDVGGGEFQEIPLPDEARNLWLRGFGRYKDSICVMLDSEHGDELWMLDVKLLPRWLQLVVEENRVVFQHDRFEDILG